MTEPAAERSEAVPRPPADATPLALDGAPARIARNFWRRPSVWVLTAVGALAVAGIVIVLVVALSPRSFTTEGTYDIQNDDSVVTNSDGTCSGGPGYDDIVDGTQVTVFDAQKNIVAVGNLNPGSLTDSTTCEYSFTIDDVPGGLKFYGVEVGKSSRGVLQYTEKEMRADIGLKIG